MKTKRRKFTAKDFERKNVKPRVGDRIVCLDNLWCIDTAHNVAFRIKSVDGGLIQVSGSPQRYSLGKCHEGVNRILKRKKA